MLLAKAVNRNFSATVEPVEPTRRDRRRQETIDEILTIAEAVMNEEGVNGLSLSEVARRLGVKPPSIYKYFESLSGIFDALFERGQRNHLESMRAAMTGVEPGLAAIEAGLNASGEWALAHPALAQLLFWRPVPGFEPSDAAMAPSIEMVQTLRAAFADAIAAKQLGGDPDEAVWLSSVLVSGVIGQTLSNEPDLPWGSGRFSSLLPKLIAAMPVIYPPKPGHRTT